MRKYHIHIANNIPDEIAFDCILEVIRNGKISGGFGKNLQQYSYLSLFTITSEKEKYRVIVSVKTKYKDNTDTIYVKRYKGKTA